MNEDKQRPLEPEGGNLDKASPPKRDPYKMPEVLGVKVTKVRYKEARPHYVGAKRLEASAGVEFLVRTVGPIPIRALSPLLIVGEVAIDAYERVGNNEYLFVSFAPDDLKEGAPISLGWSKAAAPRESSLRYEPGKAEEER